VRKPKKVEPPEEPLPWLLIGGALAAVAALGALAFVLLRRRRNASLGKIAPEHKPAKLLQEGAPEAAPKPSFMAAVKARLMPGRNNPAPAAAAAPAVAAAEEPVLTDVLTQPE
jgi:LPXTG-motif cell wall-anchored protein